MKKTAYIIILAVVLLLSAAGCRTADESESIRYETFDELKAATGLLVPAALPDGFEPDSGWITGVYYKRVDAWEYSVSLFVSDMTEIEFLRQIEGDGLAVKWLNADAYEPKHRLQNPKHPLTQDRETEAERYAALVSEGKTWEIGGVTAAYDIEITKKEKAYSYFHEDETEREKPENVYPPHYEAITRVVFEQGGIYYSLSFTAYGNIGITAESAEETAGGIARELAAGLIRGGSVG
jgi:hypothetical protein